MYSRWEVCSLRYNKEPQAQLLHDLELLMDGLYICKLISALE